MKSKILYLASVLLILTILIPSTSYHTAAKSWEVTEHSISKPESVAFPASTDNTNVISVAGYTGIPDEITFSQFTSADEWLHFSPMVTVNNRNTNLHISNLGTNICSVFVIFVDTEGTQLSPNSFEIPVNGTHKISLETLGLPPGFEGSAVVATDQPVGVVVSISELTENRLLSYASSPFGYSRVILPSIMRNYYGWESSAWVQNVGSESSVITVTYKTMAGDVVYVANDVIPTLATHVYHQADITELGDSFQGWAEVTSDGYVSVIVEIVATSASGISNAAAYKGLGTTAIAIMTESVSAVREETGDEYLKSVTLADYRLDLPRQQKNVDGWSSSIFLLNPGLSTASMVVSFLDEAGTMIWTTYPEDVLPGHSATVYLPGIAEIPDGFDGSAIVSYAANSPLAVLTFLQNQDSLDINRDVLAANLNTLLPTSNLHFPHVVHSVTDQQSTQISVQNTEYVNASVTITYYDQNGVISAIIDDNIPSLGVSRYSTNDVPELGDSWTGSISVSSDQSIVAEATTILLSTPNIQYNGLYATASDDLWLVDETTGTSTLVGPIGFVGTDVAFNGTDLYGISFTDFYRIDPSTGASSLIGSMGSSGVNALTIALDGTAYAANLAGELLEVDITTGEAGLIGNMGSGYSSAGDIAISDDNQVYASVNRVGYDNSWLVFINLTNGAATPIGDIGYAGVWGLSFKDGILYGVTSSGQIIEIDTENPSDSELIGTNSAGFWGLATSGKALSGSITSPEDYVTIGPSSLSIEATAEYPGGPGVEQVEFFVSADGQWRSISSDTIAPYLAGWETPLNIQSQQLLLRIDVVGQDLERTNFAGGVRHVNFIQSLGDPELDEQWIPNRAYLNQRSLSLDGDSKCSVASMAMVLAMEGLIDNDYQSMADKANEMYPEVLSDDTAYVYLMRNELIRQGADASYFGEITDDEGWGYLKAYIQSGHPVIVRSAQGVVTPVGHYVTAVGFLESPSVRKFIAYDPFGRWRGFPCAQLNTPNCSGNYYLNVEGDPLSHVGQWVYYDFDLFFGDRNYLIVPTTLTHSTVQQALTLTDPDIISPEPLVIGTNPGVRVMETIFLPQVVR